MGMLFPPASRQLLMFVYLEAGLTDWRGNVSFLSRIPYGRGCSPSLPPLIPILPGLSNLLLSFRTRLGDCHPRAGHRRLPGPLLLRISTNSRAGSLRRGMCSRWNGLWGNWRGQDNLWRSGKAARRMLWSGSLQCLKSRLFRYFHVIIHCLSLV